MNRLVKSIAATIILLGVFLTSVGLSPLSRTVRAKVYYQEGLTYEAEGRLELAEQRFKAALRFDPDLADAYLALGAAYLKMERLNLAEMNTLQAVGLLPRTSVRNSGYRGALSMAYNNLGVIEAKRSTAALMKGDRAAAAAHWKQSQSYYLTALDVDKDNLHAHQNLQQSLSLSD
jgi:tetratricopeptide (TPR) repeat protein